MQYNGEWKNEEEEQQKKVAEGVLENGGAGDKPKIVPQNPAGAEPPNKENQASVLGSDMISNPAANWEDTVLDSGLKTGDSSAQVGVRKVLEDEFRVDPNRIGYDGTHVTLDGKSVVTPADNRDGTTYVHSKEDVLRGLTSYASNNGMVAVRDYVKSSGVPMDIEWNGTEGTVSINGVSIKPTYVIEGKAYIPRSQLDELIRASKEQTGIRSDKDILDESEAKYGDRRDEAFSKFMDYGAFSYSAKDDRAFQEFMDAYKKGVQDEYNANMAQARFRTGGVPSSAVMQQAANIRKDAMDDSAKYRQQYEDRAYERWADGLSQAYNELLAVNGLMQDDYNLRSGSNDKVADAWYKNQDFDWTQGAEGREQIRDENRLETELMDGELYRKHASGIYEDEANMSHANAEAAALANRLAEKNLTSADIETLIRILNAAPSGKDPGVIWNKLMAMAGIS